MFPYGTRLTPRNPEVTGDRPHNLPFVATQLKRTRQMPRLACIKFPRPTNSSIVPRIASVATMVCHAPIGARMDQILTLRARASIPRAPKPTTKDPSCKPNS